AGRAARGDRVGPALAGGARHPPGPPRRRTVDLPRRRRRHGPGRAGPDGPPVGRARRLGRAPLRAAPRATARSGAGHGRYSGGVISAIVLIKVDASPIPEAAAPSAATAGITPVHSVTGHVHLIAVARVARREGLPHVHP